MCDCYAYATNAADTKFRELESMLGYLLYTLGPAAAEAMKTGYDADDVDRLVRAAKARRRLREDCAKTRESVDRNTRWFHDIGTKLDQVQ